MKTLGFFVYFQIEKKTEDSYTLSDGTEIWLDTNIQPMHNARQYGTVYSVPEDLNKYKKFDDGVTLRKGDKIFFHHFVVEEDSKVEIFDEEVYRLPYQQIFAVERDGEVIPLNDFVFLEPEEKDDKVGDIYDPNAGEYKKNTGRVIYTSLAGSKDGMKKGDRVFFKVLPYDMKLNDMDVYRMHSSHILAVIGDEIQLRG